MVFDNVILILPDFTFFEDIFINPAMVLNFYTAYNYVPSSLSCNMSIESYVIFVLFGSLK